MIDWERQHALALVLELAARFDHGEIPMVLVKSTYPNGIGWTEVQIGEWVLEINARARPGLVDMGQVFDVWRAGSARRLTVYQPIPVPLQFPYTDPIGCHLAAWRPGRFYSSGVEAVCKMGLAALWRGFEGARLWSPAGEKGNGSYVVEGDPNG